MPFSASGRHSCNTPPLSTPPQPRSVPAVASGLVSLSTSDTPTQKTQQFLASQPVRLLSPPLPPPPLLIDRHRSRVTRMRRSVLTVCKEIEAAIASTLYTRRSDRPRPVLLTLTYRPDVDPAPRHVSDLLKRVRQWADRRDLELPYVWCAELHQSGRVHYHVVLWLPSSVMLPKPDKQGWWPHGMTNLKACKSAPWYVAKYASKGHTPDGRTFPPGLRIHGSGGLTDAQRMARRWWCLPTWAREWFPRADLDPRRTVGGFFSRSTGEFRPSPWRIQVHSGGAVSAVCAFPQFLHPDSKIRLSLPS